MGHEAANDEIEAAEFLSSSCSSVPEKRWEAFGDHGLAGQRRGFRHDLSTKTLRIEQPAADAQVMHMHDRCAGRAQLPVGG